MLHTKQFEVVTICGSTRFKDEILQVQKELTLKGKVVLSCPFFSHTDGEVFDLWQRELISALHCQKIEMADTVYVVNKGGYIGAATMEEIRYAQSLRKTIVFHEDPYKLALNAAPENFTENYGIMLEIKEIL